MKLKKTLSSLFLLSLVVGSMAPGLVTAAEITDSSSMTDVSTSATTTSSSSTTDADASSTIDSSTTDDSSTTTAPSTDASSVSDVEVSSSSSASQTEETTPALSEGPTAVLERAGVLEGIIGKDDQYKVNNTTADPYRKVVRLVMTFPNGIYVGSGVLISRDTILTAAHNVYDSETKNWALSITAYPAKDGPSNPYGSYTANNYYILKNYRTLDGDSEYDTAVIKLSSQVDARVGYLNVSTSQTVNQRIQVPGYPAATDSKSGYMYTMFGNITEMEDNLIGYTIDTEGGQSGAGVLNSNNQVIAVHILGMTDKDGKYTINAARRVQADTLDLIDTAQNDKASSNNVEKYKNVTYRLYNGSIKHHLYTQGWNEVSVLQTRGWKYEGVTFTTAPSDVPVYRMYSPVTKEHFFTTSANERDVLKTRGWDFEGVAWYSSGGTPVYRLYNGALRVHLYTTDTNEVNTLKTRGWVYENVAWYAVD